MERVVAHYKPVIDKLAGKLPENPVINYPADPINLDLGQANGVLKTE